MKTIAIIIFFAGMFTAVKLNTAIERREAAAATRALLHADDLLKQGNVTDARKEIHFAITALDPLIRPKEASRR